MQRSSCLSRTAFTGLTVASFLMLSGAAMAQHIPTETTLHSSPRPSERDMPVALVAIVTADTGTPEGRVRFFEGDSVLGGAPLVSFVPGQGALALGYSHSCALDNAGGVRCTGANTYGKLGDGTTEQRDTPVGVLGLSSGVTAITASHHHTCALNTQGGVKCWGLGDQGQLGDGKSGSYASFIPTQVFGLESGVVKIAAGGYHTCAVTDGGAAQCWGDNSRGQLGNTGLAGIRSATPVAVMGLERGVVDIAAGLRHTCALRRDGRVLCWGANGNGELGDGTTEDRPMPVRTRRLSDITALALGNSHSCALTEDGAVRCWGYGTFGQLGQGTWDDSATPVRVRRMQSGVSAISAAQHHSCAILDEGGLRCWGANSYGQLGDGSNTSSNTPVRARGMQSGTVAAALGASHSCALQESGLVRCWGDGTVGQLGKGALDPDPNKNVHRRAIRMRGGAFGPVEGTAMATFVTDPLPRGRYEFSARYSGSDLHQRSASGVLTHRVTR